MAPYLFWANRYEPYFVGSMQTASSGKIATVYTPLSGSAGKPMRVNYRMALNTEVLAWLGYIGSTFTMFSHTVMFAFSNPLTHTNEVLGDEGDPGITYGGSLDYYKGTLNLIITA